MQEFCNDCKRPKTLRRYIIISVIQKTEQTLEDLDFFKKIADLNLKTSREKTPIIAKFNSSINTI